jgi:hypothetical protein
MSAAHGDAERQARIATSIARHEAPVKPQYIRPAAATTAATQPDQAALAHAGKGGKRGKVRGNPAAAKWLQLCAACHLLCDAPLACCCRDYGASGCVQNC